MKLVDCLTRYRARFLDKHGTTLTLEQWSALNALLGCRTGQYGDIALSCTHCRWSGCVPQSCGHRFCVQCQHHTTTQWLERQQRKLLPVKYFMVTFTLPFELRRVARAHQTTVYGLMFEVATTTLQQFAANNKHFNVTLGMTGVLHTHTRRLDYHPHIHFVVPAGGIHVQRREWRKRNGQYLFKEQNLAKVFRARLLKALHLAGISLPSTPKQWVVDCEAVGYGLPALKYLSRYLYRGVISEKNLIADDGRSVTFRYQDNKTQQWHTRTETGEDFIALLLQHVLPKGFRRVRDYGFLHGNAKRMLHLVQLILKVALPKHLRKKRPPFLCQHCHNPLQIVGFIRARPQSG